MKHILLIEDEQGIAEPLLYQLEKAGYSVVWSPDGSDGLERFRGEGADLVLLDLMLPGMSGEDVCSEIRKMSGVPIIMLTAKDDEVDTIVGLEIGADDYVTKPFSTRELIARIKAVLRREQSPVDAGPLEGGDIRLDPERREVTVRGAAVHLPKKEFDLLEALMDNAGRVMTREALIDRVWGADYFGDMRTLDVHVKRLRSKCEVDPRDPKHLLTVRGVGYRFMA
ncbi:MAG TPA: response regulator transcription factor [Actinomycetota bacterium]|nr:response regulator transcription factor [Actinomycetota bacterium]